MSIETWKLEFYPVEASELETSSDIECLEHSLKKWEGFKPENLEEHELGMIANEHLLYNSCALCEKYSLDCGTSHREEDNILCPIVRFRGYSCDGSFDNLTAHDKSYEFQTMKYNSNPEPMISLLEATLEFVKEKGE